ncbi:hypothetical protein VKT23_005393 [Stygiomarasmius scandens]|uniref:Uncharacterized protein n=1 Tax=Marasmiellus scandens TaxID=2682957 RepID=A0ABR1JPY5_9AGAR
MQVSNLVWLANFGTFVALASYSRQKAASKKQAFHKVKFDYGVKYAAMLQTMFSMALTIYMWAHVDDFCHFELDDAGYVFFVIKAPALGSGRTAGLIFSSILTALYLLLTLHELLSYYRNSQRMKHKLGDEEKGNDGTTNPIPDVVVTHHDIVTPRPAVICKEASNSSSNSVSSPAPPSPNSATTFTFPDPFPLSPRTGNRRPRRRRWSSNLDPMFVGIVICQILVFTYFIISSELLLKYNHADDGGSYGFGQILALVIVIPSALSVSYAIRENGFKRRPKGKKSKRRRHHTRKRSERSD